ncbi:MAG: hypothetical protein NVSMB49_24490 [Ktedonobacteraceae bacterium]
MSLSSHLKDSTSPIGQFIKQRFSHTASLTKDANRQLAGASTLRPNVQAYPYQNIGTAIDYRIRYTFALTQYRGLVAWRGATMLAFKPLESELDVPVSLEDWMNAAVPIDFDPWSGIAEGSYPIKFVEAFFDSLETFLNTVQPVKRRLDVEHERMLARYCYVLALFEQVFRAGRSAAFQGSPLVLPAPKQSVEALLAIPLDVYVDDIRQLSTLFFDQFQHLLSLPTILNPNFAGSKDVGGADADLVIDNCLVDIKTSVASKIAADYLYQLVGYLLLDYNDNLKMNAAGIYMARQGMLFTWSVSDFVQQLTGESTANLAALREEFRIVCQSTRKRIR